MLSIGISKNPWEDEELEEEGGIYSQYLSKMFSTRYKF